MISLVLMAAMSTTPEMNANLNLFKRRHHAPAAECSSCDAPAAPCGGCGDAAPTTPADPANPTPPAAMPKGDTTTAPKADTPKTDAPKGDKTEVAPAPKKEAPIDIPAPLKDAIDKSEQKTQIYEYLNNTSVPREKRIQYLATVRQTLMPDEKK